MSTTPPATRAAAQQAAAHMEAFAHELARLEAAGALHLDEAQRAAIAANQQAALADWRQRFDIDVGQRQRQLSWGVKLAAFLAALALGMGVFLLLWRLWRHMGEAGKVMLPLLAALVFTAGCGWLAAREKGGHFARLFGVLACVCFGLDLMSLGRMFNLPASPGFFLLLGAFALALALAGSSRLLLAAGLGTLAVFVAAQCLRLTGWWWDGIFERPETFLPAAALLAALAWALQRRGSELAATVRAVALLAWFVPALMVGFGGDHSFLPFTVDTVEALWQTLAGVSAVALAVLGVRRGWTETVRLSVFFGTLLLIIKFFNWWWDALPREFFFLLIGMLAVLAVLLLRRLRASTRAGSTPAAAEQIAAPWRGLPWLAQRGWSADAQRALLGAAAALAVLALGNAAAVLQVRANTAGVQAQLQLSAREVELPSRLAHASDRRAWDGRSTTVRLQVRETCDWADSSHNWCGERNSPWLTAEKARALGFDVGIPLEKRQKRRTLARPAWLVLELAGDAWQQEVAHVRQRMEQAQQDVERAADAEERKSEQHRLRRMQETLRKEQEEKSRLFIVDAGSSAEELRQRWPDATRHAIVPGTVRWRGGAHATLRPLNNSLYVPRRFIAAAQATAEANDANQKARRHEDGEGAGSANLPAAPGPLVRIGARGLPWIAAWNAAQN